MACLFAPLSARHRQRVNPRGTAQLSIGPNPIEDSDPKSSKPFLSIPNPYPNRSRPRSRLSLNIPRQGPHQKP